MRYENHKKGMLQFWNSQRLVWLYCPHLRMSSIFPPPESSCYPSRREPQTCTVDIYFPFKFFHANYLVHEEDRTGSWWCTSTTLSLKSFYYIKKDQLTTRFQLKKSVNNEKDQLTTQFQWRTVLEPCGLVLDVVNCSQPDTGFVPIEKTTCDCFGHVQIWNEWFFDYIRLRKTCRPNVKTE